MKIRTISRHDIAEKLLKMALYINHSINHFEYRTSQFVNIHDKLLYKYFLERLKQIHIY
jgi:tRNA(Ile)-lysidine synthase TilS/MesJ